MTMGGRRRCIRCHRRLVGDRPFLIPGVGTQGRDIEATVQAGHDSTGLGQLMSSSQAILHASSGEDYAEEPAQVASATGDQIRLVSTG